MTKAEEDLVDRFYAAFASRDGEAMGACYAPDVRFWDPVFRELHGPEAIAMWRMLTRRATDLRVDLLERSVPGESGWAHWRAEYTFGQTGRHVVNDVRARFRFGDGLIVEHRDEFDFHRWAAQALGPAGRWLGWTPLLRAGVHRRAKAGLAQFLAGQGSGE